MSWCVDVTDLTRTFGAFVAVDKVSFRIRTGSIFGFLGPNGAGKSTTIRMLLGILPISSGAGRVLGFDIATQGAQIRSRVGYMSQKFSLYEDLTVTENLDFFGGVFGLANGPRSQRIRELLELARLGEHRHVLASQLPGGIRQRLAFAAALIQDPDIVFLDEPTGAVDPAQRRYLWDIIVGLSQAGKTVMVTTHYMDEVERCDEICFIHRGRLIARGTPSELKTQNLQGQILQFTPTRRAEALLFLQGRPLVQHPFPAGSQVRFGFPDGADTGPLAAELHRQGLLAGSLEAANPNLEDVFIALSQVEA